MKLLPNNCPYPSCASSNVTIQEGLFTKAYSVRCFDCGAHGPNMSKKNKAIKEWNNVQAKGAK